MQSHHCLSIYSAAEKKGVLLVSCVDYNSSSPSRLNRFAYQRASCNPLLCMCVS